MNEERTIEERVRRIEDREAIKDLAVLYGFVMDERDIDGIHRLFAADAELRSQDGVFAAVGIDDIVETYKGRFAVLGPTNHVSHGHVVRLDDADPDRATGLVAASAEVVRNGQTMWVALRYKDTYRRTEAGWRFASRLMSYMYYIDVNEYADGLREEGRNRAYRDERPADWPEALTPDPDLSWLRDVLREPAAAPSSAPTRP
ncbi:nuclear transport factor 2 family protein [Georgenia sp. AZ-5]|uniref:nuclear transport factor 2 family protein n=1 Tax=Georgenia sp. AZ-5 TaxID=3367526 RepID=UPI0037542E45